MNKLEEEKKCIVELKQILLALSSGMDLNLISKEGMNEIYGLLTDYRRWIHFNHKDDIDCGCK
jgi:hypothetical protein